MLTRAFEEVEGFLTERYVGWEGSEQFEGSGDRLARMYDELCWSNTQIDKEVKSFFKASYKHTYSEMLVSGPTSVWTLCPHHLVPCNFKVHIGYIPNGKVLGLSKFSRVAITLGKRPVMQEQYSQDVANAIKNNLDPLGVGVYVIGKHGCMGCRGVHQEDVEVVTSVLKDQFLEDGVVRNEFLSICRR